MGVVEEIEIRDIKDYASKAYDKLTGGDGTADGEKLTDNMKNPLGPPLSTQQNTVDLTKRKIGRQKTPPSDHMSKDKKKS
jgi:hypothetical protein